MKAGIDGLLVLNVFCVWAGPLLGSPVRGPHVGPAWQKLEAAAVLFPEALGTAVHPGESAADGRARASAGCWGGGRGEGARQDLE